MFKNVELLYHDDATESSLSWRCCEECDGILQILVKLESLARIFTFCVWIKLPHSRAVFRFSAQNEIGECEEKICSTKCDFENMCVLRWPRFVRICCESHYQCCRRKYHWIGKNKSNASDRVAVLSPSANSSCNCVSNQIASVSDWITSLRKYLGTWVHGHYLHRRIARLTYIKTCPGTHF